MPTRLIFYDTETRPIKVTPKRSKHVLKLGWVCAITRYQKGRRTKHKWCAFRTIEEFWNFVLSFSHEKSKIYLIAHQQHFDFSVVDGFSYLAKEGYKKGFFVLDAKLFIASFRKDKKTIVVLDSLNWFKLSVKELGDSIGLPKGEIDFETCHNEELSLYCYRDVEIIKTIVLQYIDFLVKYRLGTFQKTIASQSFTAFRHRFMQHEIFIHANKSVIKLERESYRGGRNEAFFIGHVPTSMIGLDFNSLYPAVMKEAELPVKLIKWTHCISVDGLKRFLTRYCVTADVNITINEPCIAMKGERLLFPIGTFDVVLTTPELLYVLKHHKINSVKCCALYPKACIFETYIKELYNLRLGFKHQKNEVYNLITKLFLNSLYGKFGQHNEVIKKVGTCPLDLIEVEKIIVHETKQIFLKWSFGGEVYIRTGEMQEARHSFVAIASHITALARMKLWQVMKTAGRDNVFYCDTDSLFVNLKGYKRLKDLIDDKQLGALKVEYKNEDMLIFGCKDYQVGKKVKIKGVKEDATKIDINKYEQTRFLKFRSLLRRSSLDAPIEELYEKSLKRVYKKGLVDSRGYVTPYSL